MSSKKNRSLILSSYFSIKIHPNDPGDDAVVGRGPDGRVPGDNIDYIGGWYDSIIENKLSAVLFHDNLSDNFVKKHENDYVRFEKVQPGAYSNNDYRFFCFNKYLQGLSDEPGLVFHTDASDVVIVKDPSELVSKYPEIDYFACKDSIPLNGFPYIKIHDHYGWEDKMNFLLNYSNWDLINMGVVGGSLKNMRRFYSSFVDIRENMLPSDFNADMWVLQYLLRHYLKPCNTLIGHPVCSEFKKYQNNRKDVFFIHK